MKMYNKPELYVTEFDANDYVSACWGVGCDASASNTWEKTHVYGSNSLITDDERQTSWYEAECSHSSDHCGHATNQWLYDDDDDGKVDRMVETGTDGLGNLLCTLYTDNTFTTERKFDTVTIGEMIYWTTQAGAKIWHHIGTVFQADASHPNRS